MAKQPDDAGQERAAYPYYNWKKALEVANAVQRVGGGRSDVSKAALAHELQMGEDSPSLSQQMSSARSFGMIEGRGSYRLTEIAFRYFFPTTPADSRQAELAFIASPSSFKFLLDRFDGNTLPGAGTLANVLLQHGGVPRSWKDRVAGIFLDTASQLRLIDAGGRLRYGVAVQAAAKAAAPADIQDRNDASEQGAPAGPSPPPPIPLEAQTERLAERLSHIGRNVNVWVFSEAGGTVRVETPNPLPRALWERIMRYVQVLEPAAPGNGGDHGST